VLVGGVGARIAYASVVLYDDRDGDGRLSLARANRLGALRTGPGSGDRSNVPTELTDVIYGASLVTMTAPDQRIGYREGGFPAGAAFYPRAGCPTPPPAFSVLGAGGFTAQAGLAAAISKALPAEDPAACSQAAPGDAPISVALQPPDAVSQVACTEDTDDGTVAYREPPTQAPDFTARATACVHLPSFGPPSDVTELIVTGRSDDSCQGLTHYVLRGCSTDPSCVAPTWDHRAAPPPWWPC
jgi:hypothetical protein